MNLIFDTHAHYDDKAFDGDREALLSGLRSNGVGNVVNVSARLDEIPQVLALSDKYDFMYATVGVHPSEVYELKDSDFAVLEKYVDDSKINANENDSTASQNAAKLQACGFGKVVAIGEIGLDYHFDDTDKVKQKIWFERQIDLAKRKGLPMVIHSRDAAADTLDMIRSGGGADIGGVIHCFSYEPEMAKIYLNMGFYIGIGGVVTFKNARKLKETVSMMPLEQMLLETDCPYMAPTPHRGERNDSTLIRYVVSTVAALKGIEEDEVRRITAENACRMYGISENLCEA